MTDTMMLVKPDVVEAGRLGDVLKRVGEEGFAIANLIAEVPTHGFMRAFYGDSEGEDRSLDREIEFICSGTACAVQLVRENAVEHLLALAGAPVPAEAAPETLRHEFGDHDAGPPRNAVHVSASADAAREEASLVFWTKGKPKGLRSGVGAPPMGDPAAPRTGKWPSPHRMLVAMVLCHPCVGEGWWSPDGSVGPLYRGRTYDTEGMLAVAHTRIDRAAEELKHHRLDDTPCGVWLCEALGIGQLREIPRPEHAHKRSYAEWFWNSMIPWYPARWPGSTRGARPAYNDVVACTEIRLLQLLDV